MDTPLPQRRYREVNVVDLDVTLRCGRGFSCTLRSDRNDSLVRRDDGSLEITFPQTGEVVTIATPDMISRRPRVIRELDPSPPVPALELLDPKATAA